MSQERERLNEVKRKVKFGLTIRGTMGEVSAAVERGFERIVEAAYFEGYKDCLRHEVKK